MVQQVWPKIWGPNHDKPIPPPEQHNPGLCILWGPWCKFCAQTLCFKNQKYKSYIISHLPVSHLDFASRSLHLQHTTNIAVGFPPCCLGSPNRILRNATYATCWSGWLHRMPTIPRFSDCGQTRKTSANLPNFNQHLVVPSNLSSSPLSINNPQASATAAIRFNECKTLKYAWRW